jgi:hypothetical protein
VEPRKKIGELAAATGLATPAIRFYEQSGLLPVRARRVPRPLAPAPAPARR